MLYRLPLDLTARNTEPRYNVCPTDPIDVVTARDDRLELISVRWGLVPWWWSKSLKEMKLATFNARAESVATKPLFRDAFKRKRCLVLADGFYEWKREGKSKVPYRIALKTEEPFAFAGIWSTGHDAQGIEQPTFAILTTEANALVSQIHTRMPVILREQDEADWLNPRLSLDEAQLLLVPCSADRLMIYEVSSKVNSPAFNIPEALQPVAQE